ncbi:YceI family protein [Amycolatopsis stemonae]
MSVTTRPGTWTVDPTTSSAEFAVRKMLVKTVRGAFPILEGAVRIDPDGTPDSVTATLDATGFASGNQHRDDHIRSATFLDAATHPTLSFIATAIKPGETGTWHLDGVLTVRGTRSAVTLIATIDRLDPETADVTATTSISRRAAGVATWPRFMIGDRVDITLTIALRAQK